MKISELHSSLANEIRNLIALRRLAGTDYQSQASLLLYFDRFLVQEKFTATRVTSQITNRYQASLTHLSPGSQANRFCVVRQLCSYLAQKDPLSYVPQPRRTVASWEAHMPYIYTKTEIRALIRTASELSPRDSLRPHTYSTLLGLLYVTGIRLGEATSLNLEDFYNEQQMIYIREGKFRKSRWVPVTFSTSRAIEQYLQRRLRMEPLSPESPLFLNLRSRRLHQCTLSQAFGRLLKECGIQFGARIHDLRHTFATHRLLEWYRAGCDVNARLPWLATYMGHVGIASTQIYLQITAELLEEANARFHSHYLRYVKPQEEKS